MINWKFIEQNFSGAIAAWARDVGCQEDELSGGITGTGRGKPMIAVVYDRNWYEKPKSERRYWVFDGETWTQTSPAKEAKEP